MKRFCEKIFLCAWIITVAVRMRAVSYTRVYNNTRRQRTRGMSHVCHNADDDSQRTARARRQKRSRERFRLCTRHRLRHVRLRVVRMHAMLTPTAMQPSQPAESALSAEWHLGYIRIFSVVHTWT